MTQINERRNRPRFLLNAPLTVFVGERTISGYTRNVSDHGVYFYLAFPDSDTLEGDFEFLLELPPDVTLSNWCPIRCRGHLLRKEQASPDLTGIAAKILQYAIIKGPVASA